MLESTLVINWLRWSVWDFLGAGRSKGSPGLLYNHPARAYRKDTLEQDLVYRLRRLAGFSVF
jgi:hypothetical protein